MRGSLGRIYIARKALFTSALLSLLPGSAGAMRPVTFGSTGTLYFQESGAGAPLAKPEVSPDLMAARCIIMVTPLYPRNSGGSAAVSTVTVRVVIWKSGSVSPMRVISGPPSLQAEAMNAVRLWRYRPFLRDGEPMDVTTDVHVSFDPGKPGGMVSHPNH